MNLGPHVPPHGPSPCRICVLAEAPGEKESERGMPLVGPSGYELRRMMRTVGVELDAVYKTNVFSRRPPANEIAAGYGTLTPSALAKSLGPLTSNPTTYLSDEHLPELERLRAEIVACQPHVILALGNTATWALSLGSGIGNLRGTVHLAHAVGHLPLPRPFKVLPTFHPAAILSDWSLRTIALHDLEKAWFESASPDLSFDNTELWLEPSLADIAEFDARFMSGATICATDVETKRGQITCVSFAPDVGHSLTIPFWIEGQSPNYWPTVAEELAAWRFVARWIENSLLTKVMQNGLYDLQYFIAHGLKPRGCTEDTMLAHHSLFCELRKGLGFLGSIYAHVPSWKDMRTMKREEALKKDD